MRTSNKPLSRSDETFCAVLTLGLCIFAFGWLPYRIHGPQLVDRSHGRTVTGKIVYLQRPKKKDSARITLDLGGRELELYSLFDTGAARLTFVAHRGDRITVLAYEKRNPFGEDANEVLEAVGPGYFLPYEEIWFETYDRSLGLFYFVTPVALLMLISTIHSFFNWPPRSDLTLAATPTDTPAPRPSQ